VEGTLCGTGTLTGYDADDRICIAKCSGMVPLWRVGSILMTFNMARNTTFIPVICVYNSINKDTSNFVLN